ncbi:hypothetical protein AVDCRST_MAG84-53 [uncultured Microcoleus sp.]|uniref:Uncharacterized protein n=1 Tax=uncultured Microcoleus sp. TaxID=259945 RepID=A0A6J4KBP9_9CYAN|nr:hypothetical protein AVDCRST_MAG84-53 [uncultured Microcoleus sp.]
MVKQWLKASKKIVVQAKNRVLLHPNLRQWRSRSRLMHVEAGVRPSNENTYS